MKEDKGTITGHIGRSLKNRKVMDVFQNGELVNTYNTLEGCRKIRIYNIG